MATKMVQELVAGDTVRVFGWGEAVRTVERVVVLRRDRRNAGTAVVWFTEPLPNGKRNELMLAKKSLEVL